MTKARFLTEQILAVLKQAKMSLVVSDLIPQLGISENPFTEGRSNMAGPLFEKMLKHHSSTKHKQLLGSPLLAPM